MAYGCNRTSRLWTSRDVRLRWLKVLGQESERVFWPLAQDLTDGTARTGTRTLSRLTRQMRRFHSRLRSLLRQVVRGLSLLVLIPTQYPNKQASKA